MDESGPDETTTRRGWLSALARTARSRAREASDALGPDGLGGLVNQLDPFGGTASGDAPAEVSAGDLWGVSARVPARAPDRAVSIDELIGLAREEGLVGRDDEIRSLARSSLRMTPVVPRCADAWIRTSDDWVDVPGSEVLLAQIQLSALGDDRSGLPADGWLVLFAAFEGADDDPAAVSVDEDPASDDPVGDVPVSDDLMGDDPGEPDGVRAHGVLLDSPADVSGGPEPVALGPETLLPHTWHEAVQAIDFDGAELAAYARLRVRVQELQGVERDEDGGTDIAYHRLFGYPDETFGTMPAECAEGSSAPGDWRLLAQISVGEWRRAYVWIRDRDLKLGSFSDLRAFVR